MKARIRICAGAALAGLTFGLVLLPGTGRTQPVVGGQGFKFTEYYDAPHETQLKWQLEAARAQRQPDGRFLITDAKYQTFREKGEGELTVQAPQCLYDAAQRSISSSGPLHVQTADGTFSIDGEGFIFRQTNSTLFVSNRVHTVIHPELLSGPAAAATTNAAAAQAPGMDIFSDQFEFAQIVGRGVYEGNVRVAGTNLNSSAGKMTILIPMAERRLQTITAEQNVIIDYEKIHATGERASYSADTGLVRLTGQPTWRIEDREGSGDELVLDRTNEVFRATGHARLKMSAQSMGASGFLARPGADSTHETSATNHFVEIQCENYEIHTNLAVFRRDVRVSDRLGDQLQGEMTCSLMTLTLSGTNELQKIVAEHQVVIGQGDNQFTAERAEYTGTNGILDLTGNPAWRSESREGQGDLLRVHPARQEMLVRGNATMKLPAAELGRSAFSTLGKPKPGESKVATNDFAVVYCREYFLTPAAALFQGDVRIEHPQMKWTCGEVTLLSPPEFGNTGRVIIAEPEVVFDLMDDQGRTFHGAGDKAVYNHRITTTLTNDIIQLTGKPATLMATNIVGRNNVITLDLANHKLVAPGKYQLWGSAPVVATTTFGPLKTKSKK